MVTGHFREEKSSHIISKVFLPLFHLTICLVNNGQSVSVVAGIMCNVFQQMQ